MQSARRGALAALIAAAVSLGCADAISPSTGRLEVRMTDAPFPFSEVKSVNVHVVRVDARRDEVSDAEVQDENDMGGWVTIASPDAVFDLLTLQGGATTNLGAATLATGRYNAFRLILDTDQSSVILNDDSEVDVMWPSAAETGIKIFLDAPVDVVEGSSVMILDFDVGRSFVLRGNSISNNGLLFKPVIRAIASELTGSVSGTVLAETAEGEPVEGASVELLVDGTLLADADEANVVATTATDAEGNFTFGWILPGSYEIRVTPPDGSTLAAAMLDSGVAVVSGTETSGQLVVLVTPSP
ncbi:MAG TPA: DUF4382 domain-containing protein [Gemmatimonadaceae bacterium]|nr:DUF4382 domain-containing protein [Gemmatimonadaceae bacterium]